MPTYSYRCLGCGGRFDIFKRLADMNRLEKCSHCSFEMVRQLSAPSVRGDYEGYSCPVTGKWIEGRRAHEENLRRHGCRVLEPGETREAQRRREADDAALDASVDATVEEFFEKLPTAKKERLANEVAGGMDVTFERR